MLNLEDFKFELPEGFIAQSPLEKRDESKLFVYNRAKGLSEQKHFRDIAGYFRAGDCLVINETKVLPARFFGKKISGGKVEVLYLSGGGNGTSVLLKPALNAGARIIFENGAYAEVKSKNDDGSYTVIFSYGGGIFEYMREYGDMPLPPYIKRAAADNDVSRYQTVFAKMPGSVAAPTAGLHFTPELLEIIKNKGVSIAGITLHIGLGTFKKVKTLELSAYKMPPEIYEITSEAAYIINQSRQNGKSVFAVGTSCVRTLESAAGDGGIVNAQKASASIFIYPGYVFKAVDAMITNFHLPDSSPLFLTAAFLHNSKNSAEEAPKLIKKLYNTAVNSGYRFYSYGDAMLII